MADELRGSLATGEKAIAPLLLPKQGQNGRKSSASTRVGTKGRLMDNLG